MPKTGRPRSRSALSAVAMVPRQHSAPSPGADVAPSPRPMSGRARAAMLGDRVPIAVLAFLLGFATCYLVLQYSGGDDAIPHARTTTSGFGAGSRLP